VRSDDPQTKLTDYDNASYIPSKELIYRVDAKAVIANRVVAPKDEHLIVPQIDIKLTGNYLTKDELMILDMIANNDWKRPIYFAITIGRDKYLNLQDYLQDEGFAYRLVPIKTTSQSGQVGRVRTDLMYENVMKKFRWGNMNDPKVYLDETNIRMLMNVRNTFLRLADGLIAEGKKDSAVTVLDRCNELMPNVKVPYNIFNMFMVESYYKASGKVLINHSKDSVSVTGTNINSAYVNKGNEVIKVMAKNCEEQLIYYFNLKPDFRATVAEELQGSFYIMKNLSDIANEWGEKEIGNDVAKRLNRLLTLYQPEMFGPASKR
jgi:hypothetical protein